MFKPKPIKQILEEDLYEAEKELCKAYTGLEFAKSVLLYNEEKRARIKRQLEEIAANAPIPTKSARGLSA